MTPARIVTSDTAGIELAINALKRSAAIGIPTETVDNKWGYQRGSGENKPGTFAMNPFAPHPRKKP
jgi:hypothetical protein